MYNPRREVKNWPFLVLALLVSGPAWAENGDMPMPEDGPKVTGNFDFLVTGNRRFTSGPQQLSGTPVFYQGFGNRRIGFTLDLISAKSNSGFALNYISGEGFQSSSFSSAGLEGEILVDWQISEIMLGGRTYWGNLHRFYLDGGLMVMSWGTIGIEGNSNIIDVVSGQNQLLPGLGLGVGYKYSGWGIFNVGIDLRYNSYLRQPVLVQFADNAARFFHQRFPSPSDAASLIPLNPDPNGFSTGIYFGFRFPS